MSHKHNEMYRLLAGVEAQLNEKLITKAQAKTRAMRIRSNYSNRNIIGEQNPGFNIKLPNAKILTRKKNDILNK